MPRPTNVSEEQWKEWEARVSDLAAAREGRPSLGISPEVYREVMLAGYWLESELKKIEGLEPEEIAATTAASGQIMHGRDPWEVAQKLVEDSEMGLVYIPGDELSKALFQGHLDERFGPGVDMISAGGIERMLQAHNVATLPAFFEKLRRELGVSTNEEAREKLEKMLAESAEKLKEHRGDLG